MLSCIRLHNLPRKTLQGQTVENTAFLASGADYGSVRVIIDINCVLNTYDHPFSIQSFISIIIVPLCLGFISIIAGIGFCCLRYECMSSDVC